MRWLLLIGLFIQMHIFCQTENLGIEVRSKLGYLLPHRVIMEHLVQGHAPAVELSFVKQTTGIKEWEQRYALPRYGVTGYFSDFGNREVLGVGFGAFGFIDLPIHRRGSWMLTSKLSAGVSHVTKHYDKLTNPKNNAIGSHMNCLVVIGLNLHKQFEQSELTLGIDMTHLSNGATQLPNLGINVPYLSVGYTRYFKPLEFADETVESQPKYQRHAFYSSTIISTKQIYPTGGRNYFVGSILNFYHHQFARKVALDIGLDLIFNGAHRDMASFEAGFLDAIQAGVWAGYVLPVNQFDYILGMGYYLKNTINPDGPVYHRFGVRYRMNEHWYLNLSIKSHWGRADYFEYGILYRWR
jgi:hypothetical protein